MKFNLFLFVILIISIGGVIQRGVPILSLIGWPVYKLIVFAISLLYFFIVLFKSKIHIISPIIWYTLFVLICVSWALVSDIESNISSISALLSGALPMYVGYYMVAKGIIKMRHLKYSFLYFLLVSVLSFWGYKYMLAEVFGDREITNNIGYYFVSTLPLLYMIEKNVWRNVVLLIILLFVVLSAKRGAILCAIAGIVIYLYYQYFYKKDFSFKQTFKLSLLFIGTVVLLSLFVNEDSLVYQRIDKTFHSDDKLAIYSRRDDIYASMLDEFLSSDFISFFFGHGYNGTVNLLGYYAHNDWLEILIDYGLLGAIIYLLFVSTSFVASFSQKNDKLRFCALSVFLIYFMQTIFSMGFTSTSISITSLAMGCMFGVFSNKKFVLS